MLKYHLVFTQKRSTLEHTLKFAQLMQKMSFFNPYIKSTAICKINSFNKRVLLKSPFHYKLVKFNTINPYFTFRTHLHFYSNTPPTVIYKFFKKLTIYCFNIKLNYTYVDMFSRPRTNTSSLLIYSKNKLYKYIYFLLKK